MALAGFDNVQIGYESPSHSLLKKINKKNTFASNFLFIKFASVYNIRVTGANIIMGLLEETDNDIIEGINNLHILRFCFSTREFRHNISALGVQHSSPYYKQIKDELVNWNSNSLVDFLPEKYFKKGDSNYDIIDVISNKFSILWTNFRHIELHYLNNIYDYKLIKDRESIIYRETLNKRIINELEIEENSLEWYILKKANDRVISLDKIANALISVFEREFLNVEIFNAIEELKAARLIYTNEDYSEIITIINTNIIL